MEDEKKKEIVPDTVLEKVEETKTLSEEKKNTETEEKEAGMKAEEKDEKKSKPLNKKFILLLVVIIALALLASDYSNFKKARLAASASAKVGFTDYVKNKTAGGGTLTKEEAEKFVNENLMEGGSGAVVQEVSEENGLWKIKLTVSDQEYTTYLTKDKSTFFPQAINIADIQKQKAESEAQAKAQHEQDLANLPKNDKPTVELFVMSHCPYGTQIEKGIIPVVKALSGKIDFQLKFCDYAMHEEKELKEEMNQYCIMKDQGDKFFPYLECFLGDGDSGKCVTQVGIDANALNSCVTATDSQYKILANYANQSTWKSGTYPPFPIYQADVDKYQVSGSPTLVVNGTEISTDRDSASLLQTVCAGFGNKPEECNQSLSSTAPSTGFGYAEGTNTNESCG